MSNAIAHRGPDGSGAWCNQAETIGLGHRRLSILDLSSAGSQPMRNQRGNLTITFNGEIYNYLELKSQLQAKGYQFKTQIDTEVLLCFYEDKREKCLEDLDGMFAFAIWDEHTQELFCARDGFGEKPFYYFIDQNRFVFASEMKALWVVGVPKILNQEQLYYYLNYDAVSNPHKPTHTFYKGIFLLESAHYSIINLKGQLSKQRYWDIDTQRQENISQEAAQQKFLTLFTESIKRRLRSDVPVGSSLSGGLDSSSIVALIDTLKGKEQIQKTFSARFKNFDKDEGEYMESIIQHTNVDPHFTWSDADTFIQEFEKICYHQEEPFGSASIFAQWEVMKLAKTNQVTVLLDGQGADEIAAGYFHYFKKYYGQLYRTNRTKYKSELESYKALYGKEYDASIAFKLQSYFPNTAGKMKNLVTRNITNTSILSSSFQKAFNKQPSPYIINYDLNKDLKFNTLSLGLNNLLRYCDRNSMAHAREVRLPFLNHELVEFLFSLSPEHKIFEGWTKSVIRKSMTNLVPNKILLRTDKIGYELPQNNWLKESKVQDIFIAAKERLEKEKFLNPKADTNLVAASSWKVLIGGYYLQG